MDEQKDKNFGNEMKSACCAFSSSILVSTSTLVRKVDNMPTCLHRRIPSALPNPKHIFSSSLSHDCAVAWNFKVGHKEFFLPVYILQGWPDS